MHGLHHHPPKINGLSIVQHCRSFLLLDLSCCSTIVAWHFLVGWGYHALRSFNKHCSSNTYSQYGIRNLLRGNPCVTCKWSAVSWRNSAFYWTALSGMHTRQFCVKTWLVTSTVWVHLSCYTNHNTLAHKDRNTSHTIHSILHMWNTVTHYIVTVSELCCWAREKHTEGPSGCIAKQVCKSLWICPVRKFPL